MLEVLDRSLDTPNAAGMVGEPGELDSIGDPDDGGVVLGEGGEVVVPPVGSAPGSGGGEPGGGGGALQEGGQDWPSKRQGRHCCAPRHQVAKTFQLTSCPQKRPHPNLVTRCGEPDILSTLLKRASAGGELDLCNDAGGIPCTTLHHPTLPCTTLFYPALPGQAALHQAVVRGDVGLVHDLLAAGAKPDTQELTAGKTPMFLAVEKGRQVTNLYTIPPAS